MSRTKNRRSKRAARPRNSRRQKAQDRAEELDEKEIPHVPTGFILKDRYGKPHRYDLDWFPAESAFEISAELASLFGEELASIFSNMTDMQDGIAALLPQRREETRAESAEEEDDAGDEEEDALGYFEDDEDFEDDPEMTQLGIEMVKNVAPDISSIGRKILDAGGFELAYTLLKETRRDGKRVGTEGGFALAYTGNIAEVYVALFKVIKANFSDFFSVLSQ